MHTIKILKKDGAIETFNGEKIKRAIRKSANRVCVTLTDKEEKKVVDTVKKQLQFSMTDVPVSTVHNMVECALDQINPKVSKSYREYRDNKGMWAELTDKVYSKKMSLNFIGDRSNANSDSALVTTQKAIVYNELNSEFYKKFFLTKREERAMSDGYIYVHDRGSRLDAINCCLFNMGELLKGGFFMGNLDYQEPKSLSSAMALISSVTMNAASSQYGGFTIPEVDKILAPYAEKSYENYKNEYWQHYSQITGNAYDTDISIEENEKIEKLADEYAIHKVTRDFEQGFQAWEMDFNSVASSRGDYPFTAVTFGIGTSRFETLASSVCMRVRKEGQGNDGFKHPVLFPKLSFFYDEDLHGEGKPFEWLFNEAIECSMTTMYPDFISCTGVGYAPSIYRKYGIAISRMGCRANLSPWFERGGMEPADDDDKPIYVGRFNLGAISLNYPLMVLKAKKEEKDFFEVFEYYLNMARDIHKRTFEYLSHKKAGTNPLGFCQGGFLNGFKKPDEEIGEDFLRPMTMSFGVIGLNEASVLAIGKPIHEDNSWAKQVLEFINAYAVKYKKIDNILYAIYGTPGESLVGTQVSQIKAMHGIIKGVSDRAYLTNSFHCPVYADITPIEKQDIEFPLFHLCAGGNIAYARMRSNYNFDAFKTLTRRAMDMGFYWGNNQELNYCEKCGYAFIDADECPKCGSEEITRITRMSGYLGLSKIRGRTMYSDHKNAEFADRVSM